jgi:hypothetical protein
MECPLWLAQYTWLEIPPIVPKPWTKWTIWQYTAKGDGKKYGTSSRDVDLNYYAGTIPGLTGMPWNPISVPVEPNLPRWEVIVDSLNVRSAPNTEHPPVDQLKLGAVVSEELKQEDVWVRIGRERWCAARYQGKEYMRKIGE